MNKIKILHIADTHLGVESYGRIDPATGLNTRLGDFTSTLDEAVNYALAESVDLVVFAGDAYRTRDPNPTYQREFAKRIKRLAMAGVPVFLLAGNHDVPAAVGRANSIDIFDTLAVDNVQVARSRGIHTFQTKAGLIQIVAVPWLMRNLLLSRDDFKGKTADEINKIMVDSTAHFLDQAAERLDLTVPTIAVVHASVLGSVMGSERSVTLGSDYVLPKTLFSSQVFDYVALGHIHKHQVLGHDPLMIYSGSINRVDFGEEKEDKGFVVAEVQRGSASYQFVKVNARRFLTIEVSADCDEPTDRILSAIAAQDVDDAIVRVIIKTTVERDAQINYQEVRRALRGAFNLAAISRQVDRADRLSFAGRLVEEMTPRQALEEYLRNKQTSQERVSMLLDYADRLLARDP